VHQISPFDKANRVSELVSTFFDFLTFLKNPVHGPDGTKILPLIEEGGISLMGRQVKETPSRPEMSIFFRRAGMFAGHEALNRGQIHAMADKPARI
jgi:hypothetical protein